MDSSLQVYRSFHQNRINQYCHLIGVPLVTTALFVFLGWFRYFGSVALFASSATFIFAMLLAYYWRQYGIKVAVITLIFNLPLLYLGERIAILPQQESQIYFFVIFAVGWFFQLLGHYFEGKKPALTQNFLQTFNGPVFILEHIGLIRIS